MLLMLLLLILLPLLLILLPREVLSLPELACRYLVVRRARVWRAFLSLMQTQLMLEAHEQSRLRRYQ